MNNYNRTRLACYTTNISMSVVSCLSPLLFVTFREMYNISYTMLGLLVVVNFFTQLLVDLVLTLFSKNFDLDKTVRYTPFITFIGLLIYGVMPLVFPGAVYLWIVIGTVVFSASSGLNEVLTSPVVAAIPSENPDREISKLHSTYAWGVVGVVLVSTLFLKVFGRENWQYLAIAWSILPLCAFIIFKGAPIPDMESEPESKGGKSAGFGILLCTICIFLGGAAELTMEQWASGFIESSVGIPKIWGDVFGVAAFAALLGCGRTAFAKYGKNIMNVMLYGMLGATICYLLASLSMNPIVSIAACAICGICVSMLWPGTLICIGENFPGAGVAIYALMAAGGDMGASVAPQLVGIISDKFVFTEIAAELSAFLGITVEQVGMRAGLFCATAFPLLGVFVILALKRYIKKHS